MSAESIMPLLGFHLLVRTSSAGAAAAGGERDDAIGDCACVRRAGRSEANEGTPPGRLPTCGRTGTRSGTILVTVRRGGVAAALVPSQGLAYVCSR